MSSYGKFSDLSAFKIPQMKKSMILLIVIGIVILIIVFNAFYTVGSQEIGVIQRFGKYIKTVPSGLHMKIPFIEKVTPVPVFMNLKEEFGFRTTEAGIQTTIDKEGYEDESLMLTGDLNVIKVNWIIQYKIKDPIKYLFRVRAVRDTLRDLVESVIRQEIGNHSVDEVLTIGREEIATNALRLLQKELDDYETGIDMLVVKMKDVVPPDQVADSFNEVEKAKQEKERMINTAEKEYNQVIPEADGRAKEMISEAEGFAIERTNRALGDVAKFKYLYQQYKRAPKVTMTRLYLETMSEILPKAGRKIFLDPNQKGILNLLNLNEMVSKQVTESGKEGEK